jgi:hypothetical protein
MTLNGTLEDFSPAGILKVLSADARTGAARFGGPAGCTVYLHRGQLYFARNERTDEALATALVRPGRLTADDWGRAIEASGERPMVGELLVRDGAIAPDLLASVVLSVIYDPLIELFRDGTGEFDFETDTVHWLGPFRAFPVDAIVGEVRKRVREVDEWAATIPALDSWVEARRTLPGTASQVTLLREDWELVTSLSGPRSIEELATELGRGAYSTARVVNRLHQAGLVQIMTASGDAQVVQLRPTEPTIDVQEFERDPMLDQGLAHRSPKVHAEQPDPLTAHIGETIADALADGGTVDHEAPGTPSLSVAPDIEAEPDADQHPADAFFDAMAATDLTPDERSGDAPTPAPAPAVDRTSAAFVDPDPTQDESWDASRRVSDDNALHHDDVAPTSLDEPRPKDPNAAWLADLYAQFIDDPENVGKKKRRNEPNPVDVAFKTEAVLEGEEKVSTLKRLLGALKKL